MDKVISFFFWTYYIGMECEKVSCDQVSQKSQGYESQSGDVT